MRDFPFPGSKIVFFGNPKDMHNLFAEIFGEEQTFPSGKNPSESSADFPIEKEDCAACNARDCPIRKAPYGSTQPAPSLMEALRSEKLKLDIAEREAVLARQAMGVDEVADLFSLKVKPHPELAVPYEPGENVEAPILIKTPFGRITFPDMPKPDRDRQKRVYETSMKASKGAFDSLKDRLDATLADVRKIEKKRKDAELDDLASRLYSRMSKHFYRERGSRLSRINELTPHVSELFEENRKLKADLAAKVEVLDFYKSAVANPESVNWNTSGRRPGAAFVYVTGEEFDTLKALKAGTASVTVNPAPVQEHPWIEWIDPETGKFIMPTLNTLIEVSDPRIDGGEPQTLIRTPTGSNSVRFGYREGEVNVFLTSANGVVKPFGFKESKWRYKKT